jgi:hypothetical protein
METGGGIGRVVIEGGEVRSVRVRKEGVGSERIAYEP